MIKKQLETRIKNQKGMEKLYTKVDGEEFKCLERRALEHIESLEQQLTAANKTIGELEREHLLDIQKHQASIQSKITEIEQLKQQLADSEDYLDLNTLEDNPDLEGFIRAFWRRIAPYRHKYGKEIPFDERGKLPVEFTANMLTAFTIFKR